MRRFESLAYLRQKLRGYSRALVAGVRDVKSVAFVMEFKVMLRRCRLGVDITSH